MANAIVDVLKQNGRLVRELGVENAKLRAALDKLVKSARPCPRCPPEAECYIFSMVALGEASEALSG